MKLVKVEIELGIDDETVNSMSFEYIAEYLNNKLYTDPEFFGDFGKENIVSVMEFE